ncbi:hypothetical protein MW887_009365 [Aspergillus wentii]|nr:hypothetical protein MW887_009365 [Aspergillus wentii]
MFVPKAAAASLRNPRRRQRTSSDESVNPPKAKRQRSVLRYGDLERPSDNETEHEIPNGPMDPRGLVQPNELNAMPAEKTNSQKSLSIRGPKKPEKRDHGTDGTVVLIPLGILLSTATAGPPGLMVIMPSTGKIIYWETVSSAASFGLPRQKQNGLQGSISGLLSGEYAIEVMNAEPSGVIATFSSGRVAHITVRDSQGKPTVIVNFLRSSAGSSSGGFFDGIRNVLGGGSWRKEVAAARAGGSHQRGQRDIIIATSTGIFEVWDTHWNNGSILKKQFDIKQELSCSLGSSCTDGSGEYELKILDFAFAAGDFGDGRESPTSAEESWPIFLVVAPPRISGARNLFLVHLILSDKTNILSTRSIDLLGITASPDDVKPKLSVPRPGDTAFIVIEQSVILLSLSEFEESPTSQLLVDSNRLPQPFHDTISFRSGKEYEILGSGFEDQTSEDSHPACLVMVRGFGIIRVTALPRGNAETEDEYGRITAKHKIEQAVFYGTILENPLDLISTGGLNFPAEEIEQAALEICKELLRSESKFIPNTAISVDQNLRSRAKALDDLAGLLMQHTKTLNPLAWWELLWGAEKLAAQRAMWKIEEESRRNSSECSTFLARVIDLMSDKFKTKYEPQNDDGDTVRHWFLHDTFQMEHIIPWIFNAIKPQKGATSRQSRKMADQILKASELSLAVLETAFRYRDERARFYGINEGFLENGVLTTGYEGLPEFWTSQAMGYIETGHLLDLELDSSRAWTQQTMPTSEVPDNQIVKKISKNSARQLRILGRMHCERVKWLSAQADTGLMDEGIATEQAHIKQRKWQLFKLAGIGQLDDAIILAEEFRDMGALVELIIELQDQTKGQLFQQASLGDATHAIENETDELGNKISLYFERFGDSWAEAFFSRQISMGQSGVLFAMRKFQPFITQFLRKFPAYSRLSWINDVIGEKDYDAAARSLETLAIEHESDIWNHRVELSLAKLNKLAAWERTAATSQSTLQENIKRLEDYAEIDAVQEVVYAHIVPALQGAIDQKAEVDLAIDHFGKAIAQDRPSLHEILSHTLTKVITRQVISLDYLIDLLTLIGPGDVLGYGHSDFLGKEFYLALRIVRLSSYAQKDPLYHAALQKLVWRRCMIRDNWEAAGKAAEKMGDGAESFVHDTALFRTLALCVRDRNSEEANLQSLYMPFSPSEVILSKSDSDLLVSRYRSEQRTRIARDLDREDEIFGGYLEKGELGFWFKNLITSAEAAAISPMTSETIEQPHYGNQVELESPSADVSGSKAQLNWL